MFEENFITSGNDQAINYIFICFPLTTSYFKTKIESKPTPTSSIDWMDSTPKCCSLLYDETKKFCLK